MRHGHGPVALTSCLAAAASCRPPAGRRRRQSARAQEAAAARQSQARPAPVHERRRVHVDTFDPKPSLAKFGGKPIPITLKTERRTGAAFPSPFTFRKFGQSGIEVSEIFSNVGELRGRSLHRPLDAHRYPESRTVADDDELRRCAPGSAQLRVVDHVRARLGEPESARLHRALSRTVCRRRAIRTGARRFCPAPTRRRTSTRARHEIEKLIENIRNRYTIGSEQRRQLDLLAELNRGYQERRQNDALLEARVQSFELAYRMQMEADDAFDLSKEPEHIQKMYGEGLQARQMMIARRLLERGVRFVQVWHGAGQPWDSHDDIRANHGRLARECDQPIAALLKDLKQRGMLEDTLVIWGGEFGRTPTVELPDLGANSGMVERPRSQSLRLHACGWPGPG